MKNTLREEADIRLRNSAEQAAIQNSEEIIPFAEEPRVESTTGPRKRANADELFSMFTADIIKKKTSFTR